MKASDDDTPTLASKSEYRAFFGRDATGSRFALAPVTAPVGVFLWSEAYPALNRVTGDVVAVGDLP
ncbi:hypothetical protein [Klebsiella michiganensis]|uniref:hypothetical protein n=1 Tax=Klebsiella michiganensis TaxID=1134687 RepID=UPI003B430CDE